MSTFNEATPTTATAYKVLNLNVKYKGKMVNLGGLFVNDKSSKVLKQIFEALEAETLDASDLTVEVRDTYNSANVVEEEVTSSDFA